jgi:uncharacterized protein (TIGR03000 family)
MFVVVVLDDPALAAGSRHVQPKEGYIMVKNSLACIGVIALATVALLAVPATSEGGPLGLRGAGVGAMYNSPVYTNTTPDVYYSQPYAGDTYAPRVGLFRRIFARNYTTPMTVVPATPATTTTGTSTSAAAAPTTTTPLMPVDSNPPRVGLIRRIFNRGNAPTQLVLVPTSGTATTSTSGYRPGDATAAPSSSTAFVLVDPNPPLFPRLRRLLNRNYTETMPVSYVAAGNTPSDGITYSTSGYRPGDAANMPRSINDRAQLRISIPGERAEIWIEGQKSEQARRVEDYVSPPLTPGKQYFYEVRARWTDTAGKQVERTKSFPIVPGRPVLLDFTNTSTKEETLKK